MLTADNKSANEPIRRYKIKHLAKAKQSLSEIEKRESVKGFNCSVSDAFQVSFDGNILCGPRINSKNKWEVAKASFETNQVKSFPQVHSQYIETVLLREESNLLMSGGADGLAVVYDFEERRIKWKVDMAIGEITCGIPVKNVAILGGKQKLGFLNLESGNEIEIGKNLSLDCSFVLAICIGKKMVKTDARSKNVAQNVMVVGGQNSSVLDVIPMDFKFSFLNKHLQNSEGWSKSV